MSTRDDPRHADPELEHIGEEIQALMQKHGVGGVITLQRPKTASWLIVLPEWTGLSIEDGELRIRIRAAEPEKANAIVSYLASSVELYSDIARVFGNIWSQLQRSLEVSGAKVERDTSAPLPSGKVRH